MQYDIEIKKLNIDENIENLDLQQEEVFFSKNNKF
jgi:hypothetical protein